MDNDGGRKGTITKLFGVALIFLGMLDTMLSWRSEFIVDRLYILFIASGIFLYAIGAIRGKSNETHNQP